MKKLWLLIVFFTIISCKKEPPIDYAILSGKIKNKGETGISINGANGLVKKIIEVSEDGSFIDTLKFEAGTYILFDGKNKALVYLEPGYKVNIFYNAIDFLYTLTFNGPDSEISTYLLNKGKKKNEIIGNPNTVYKLEEDEYKARFKEIKTVLSKMITGLEGISEDFKIKELRNIHYGYLSKLITYEIYHSHFANKPDFKSSEGFLNDLKDIDYNIEEDFKSSSDYKLLVTTHYNEKAKLMILKDSVDKDLAYLKSAASSKNESIKNELLLSIAKFRISLTNDIEEFYNVFMAASTNEGNNKIITDRYNKLMTVSKGRPSPQFVDYENYTGGTTSLDDLKGKYVYINVWTTWYAPCIAEIPFLKELKIKYHGKNIVFVSVSVDKVADHDKWEQMIKEKDMGGIQLFADKAGESDFVIEYFINNIPRYILIDPAGNIVNSNAPKPSDGKLINLFKEFNIY